jgi:serine/threonine protein kinase
VVRVPPTLADIRDLTAPPAHSEPRTLGRYEVLARASDAPPEATVTYVGRQRGQWGFERIYTLRVMAGPPADAPRMAAAFLREARIGGLLGHPNVLRVIDVGSHRGQPFLVLDHFEGTTLAALLAADEPAPPSLVVSVIADALHGLQAAHDLVDATGRPLGLVHGDLGLETIVVGLDGGARITGFGGARLAGDGDGDDREPPGPTRWKAPEQLRGDAIDRRTDLFSVGAVLWTALTRHDLFGDPSYGQTILNVLRREIEPPSAYGAPSALDEVCLAALARRPGDRYPSAEAMRLALERTAGREGLHASSAEVGRWVQRTAGRELDARRRHYPSASG